MPFLGALGYNRTQSTLEKLRNVDPRLLWLPSRTQSSSKQPACLSTPAQNWTKQHHKVESFCMAQSTSMLSITCFFFPSKIAGSFDCSVHSGNHSPKRPFGHCLICGMKCGRKLLTLYGWVHTHNHTDAFLQSILPLQSCSEGLKVISQHLGRKVGSFAPVTTFSFNSSHDHTIIFNTTFEWFL